MRRFLLVIFIFVSGAAVAETLFSSDNPATRLLQLAALGLLVMVLLDRIFGWFKPRSPNRIPRSLVGEIEQLYFRCMREMISDAPNLVQVVNDLQRILSIDSNYRNARHYLNRALAWQASQVQGDGQLVVKQRNATEFRRLQEQLIDSDPAVRKAVVMELIQYGDAATDPLIALLMDEDADVRIHAATALGWVGGGDAVPPLLVALKDQNPYVRRYAARALCWVVNEEAIEGLIDALNDPDSYVRRYTARALGWSQDRRAIRPLIELLMIEQNSDVRDYAFTAMEDLGEPNVRIPRPKALEELPVRTG